MAIDTVEKDDITQVFADKVAKEIGYGGLVTHDAIFDGFRLVLKPTMTLEEFKRYQLNVMAMTDRFKSHLINEHKMHLVSVPGKGYLICLPSQQTDAAMNDLKKKLKKEINRTVNILQSVNSDMLTDDEKKYNTDSLCKVAAISAFSQKRIAL